MAIYVVDASVVIERVIQGNFTTYARILFQQANAGDEFIIPEFCLLECTNVVWKHVRFQGMPRPQAQTLLRDLRALPLKRVPTKLLLNRALDIGLDHALAVYDSVYIALAQRSRYPLITIDQPQLRAANTEGVPLKPIMDFHE